MGTWTLEGLAGGFTPLITADAFGHNFRVSYKMRYKPSTFDKFVEPPILDWYEQVKKKDHLAGEWHEYEMNMYALKPQSYTLMVWGRRYVEAYNHAAKLPRGVDKMKGSSMLLDKKGNPVPLSALGGKVVADANKKSDLVRSYLKSNGGILQIEIHDVPAITLPLGPGEHVERLLIFNVGIVGGGMRVRAEQYLHVNQATLQGTWGHVFHMGHSQTWSTRDCPRKVAAPLNLVTPMAPAFSAGEVW